MNAGGLLPPAAVPVFAIIDGIRAPSRARWRADPPRQLSRKLLSTLDRLGCLSFRSAFASICRMRSRVTENFWPTSSSVWSLFMPMPKRMRKIRSSRGVSDPTATRTDRLVRFSARGGSDQDRRRRDRPDQRGGRRSIAPGDRQYRTEIIPLTRSGCNRVALRIRVLSLRRGS